MDDKEVKAHQAKLMAELLEEMTTTPKPNPLRYLKMEFLLKLSDVRLKKHLTQAQLAEKTGLTQSAISRAESIEGNPSLRTLLTIAQALDAELVLQSVKLKSDKEGPSTWKKP